MQSTLITDQATFQGGRPIRSLGRSLNLANNLPTERLRFEANESDEDSIDTHWSQPLPDDNESINSDIDNDVQAPLEEESITSNHSSNTSNDDNVITLREDGEHTSSSNFSRSQRSRKAPTLLSYKVLGTGQDESLAKIIDIMQDDNAYEQKIYQATIHDCLKETDMDAHHFLPDP